LQAKNANASLKHEIEHPEEPKFKSILYRGEPPDALSQFSDRRLPDSVSAQHFPLPRIYNGSCETSPGA
jgi:hypothetical protein